MKKSQDEAIKAMQQDGNYVILSNPLASPKFIRMMGKGKEMAVNDIYTPKIFIEIASKLTPEHLEGLNRNQTIKLEIKIKDFLQDIGANIKNYKHLIDSIEIMQSHILKWREGDEVITTSIINKAVHNEKTGKVEIYVDSDIARHILEVKKQSNFHFLKSNIFRLQNAQAIKFYPFFKSWENYKQGYETGLDRFKEQFGYNTNGYTRFSLFEAKVLKQATEEINEKTDIFVTYEITGENLDGLRPRVTGLIFWVTSKDKIKILSNGQPHTPQEPIRIEPVEKTAAPQEQKLKNTEIQAVSKNETTDLEPIYKEWKKLNFVDKLLNSGQETFIQNLIRERGFEEVHNVVIGLTESKTLIKSLAIFYEEKVYLINKGRAKQELQKQQEKEAKKKEVQQVQEQERFFKDLEHRYNEDKKRHYQKKYNELTEENREQYLQEIWEGAKLKSVYFRNNNRNDPNSYAIEQVGEIVTFPNGYDYQKAIKGYALKTFAVQIDFDENDKMILVNLVNAPIESDPVPVGKFDREKAPQQTTTEAIRVEPVEEVEPIKEQNEIKPTASHISKRVSNEEEAPKGFSDLLRSGANNLFNKFTKK
jgi:plasmid replication initiation protein